MEKYWKTETIDGKFHMYRGDRPNIFWEEFDPDVDTEEYYEANGLIKDFDKGTFKYAVVRVNESDI